MWLTSGRLHSTPSLDPYWWELQKQEVSRHVIYEYQQISWNPTSNSYIGKIIWQILFHFAPQRLKFVFLLTVHLWRCQCLAVQRHACIAISYFLSQIIANDKVCIWERSGNSVLTSNILLLGRLCFRIDSACGVQSCVELDFAHAGSRDMAERASRSSRFRSLVMCHSYHRCDRGGTAHQGTAGEVDIRHLLRREWRRWSTLFQRPDRLASSCITGSHQRHWPRSSLDAACSAVRKRRLLPWTAVGCRKDGLVGGGWDQP